MSDPSTHQPIQVSLPAVISIVTFVVLVGGGIGSFYTVVNSNVNQEIKLQEENARRQLTQVREELRNQLIAITASISNLNNKDTKIIGDLNQLDVRILPSDKAITKETFETNRDRQDSNLQDLEQRLDNVITKLRDKQIDHGIRITTHKDQIDAFIHRQTELGDDMDDIRANLTDHLQLSSKRSGILDRIFDEIDRLDTNYKDLGTDKDPLWQKVTRIEADHRILRNEIDNSHTEILDILRREIQHAVEIRRAEIRHLQAEAESSKKHQKEG